MKILKRIFTKRYNLLEFILGSMIAFQFYMGNIAWWEFTLYLFILTGISVFGESKIKEEE